ncbi:MULTISPECIES: PLD nuclease N-terminal domain-containing protein [unclassified Paracoccus (in: a-proteobacteria)]|uniref:PLD nuclease N-terminal domain-containing protein n=1 Tax=unclassified Paracoccus (in: a-proteobacteria) TaxID=2688777 RepID=UPI001602F936|nr:MULTISPECIES: PLD nuclease N-terminal domain-containing protein [unclassified Paracoccus (in: a-proteobacteria)]MBB1492583.1 PLDc_N domain-containing protein [Paracoccus sp. MC1854]MBB1499733.1 PLDc_N domain-containing protein [Paracoccus sp. MC1862]QQO44387.1 PLDc_N domain-containing protein [Paracoccus sp. MC1862]
MSFVNGLFGFIIFILDIWAIASIIRSPAGTGSKILWVLLVAILPVLGLIIWWFAGPKADQARRL